MRCWREMSVNVISVDVMSVNVISIDTMSDDVLFVNGMAITVIYVKVIVNLMSVGIDILVSCDFKKNIKCCQKLTLIWLQNNELINYIEIT